MSKLRTRKNTPRNQRGSGIVEGVCGIVLVTSGAVLGTLLLVDSSIASFFKEKAGFVAMQTANYGAGLSKFDESKISATAKDLLQQMNLPADTTQITVKQTLVNNKKAVSVTIRVDAPLIGKGDVLPTHVNVEDTSVALNSGSDSAFMYMSITDPSMNKKFILPVLREQTISGGDDPATLAPIDPDKPIARGPIVVTDFQ